MNLTAIKNVVTSKFGQQVLVAQKHSPTILFGIGVVGVVGTVVLASRATLKIDDVLEELETKKGMAKNLNTKEPEKFDDAALRSDLVVIHTKAALAIAKLYAPSIIVGVASIGCLGGSHMILRKRNAGLMAAYAAVDKAFKEYRQRVVADVGADKDREYRYGTVEREVYSEKKNGEPVVTTVKSADTSRPSQYAKLFNESNKNYQRTPEYNVAFLRSVQNYLNDRLRARGHVSLNDAYDELGFERTSAGYVTGWIWQGDGDNFIDFGVWTDSNMSHLVDFMNGREGEILLDFNVDGVIWDKIGKNGGKKQ